MHYVCTYTVDKGTPYMQYVVIIFTAGITFNNFS